MIEKKKSEKQVVMEAFELLRDYFAYCRTQARPPRMYATESVIQTVKDYEIFQAEDWRQEECSEHGSES